MDLQNQFCHNPTCLARGVVGQGNIVSHSLKEHRYTCTTCGKVRTVTDGTLFYRRRTDHDLMTTILTLVAHSCPLQAIVATFGIDERTVAAWQPQAGEQARQVHEHLVEPGQVNLGHVQADEIWVTVVGRHLWQAMAMAVTSRLWLGGVISERRDRVLITRWVERVRRSARRWDVLVCVDGWSSDVTAFGRVFRHRVLTGQRGRPRLVREPGRLMAQVVKPDTHRHVTSVVHHVVSGTPAAITAVLTATHTGTVINTADIERLNATFRQALAILTRRGRTVARTEALVEASMWLVGTAYNFCWLHDSLRVEDPDGHGRRWRGRTPAMAAGLTDHCWTMYELFSYQIPPAPWVPAKQRGRPPKPKQPPAQAVAA